MCEWRQPLVAVGQLASKVEHGVEPTAFQGRNHTLGASFNQVDMAFGHFGTRGSLLIDRGA